MPEQLESTTSISSRVSDQLPSESQIFVVPPPRPDLQKISSAFVSALYIGAQSAFGTASRLNAPLPVALVERVENASAAFVHSEVACKVRVLDVLNSQHPEDLSDGMTSGLGIKLAGCLQTFGDASLATLAATALRGAADPDALSHALRWVGRFHDADTFQGRLLLLTRSLEAPSAIVRDGAGLGLVELGSQAALPALAAAIEKETNRSLREDLEQAAEYLRSK